MNLNPKPLKVIFSVILGYIGLIIASFFFGIGTGLAGGNIINGKIIGIIGFLIYTTIIYLIWSYQEK